MADLVSILKFASMRGVSDARVHAAIKEGKIKQGIVTVKGRRWIDPEIASKEWDKHLDPTHKRVTRAAKKQKEEADIESPDGITLAQVKIKQEIIRTQKMNLDYQKRKGTLVEKDAVYKALFDYAQEIRIELESIPDKVVDDMLAAADRHKARTILVEAIEDSLILLSKQVNIR